MRICIFGASITFGHYDRERGGWVDRLHYYLKSEKGFTDVVYNLGVSGDTTEDFLYRFDIEAEARNPHNGIIVFAISTNDPQFLIEENKLRVPIEKYEKNLNLLLEKARKYTQNINIVGITPVDESKTVPLPRKEKKAIKNENIRLYNKRAKEICEKENVKFIDLYGEMVKMDYKKLLFDGLHPNSEGHQWIAEKVIKELNFYF